MIPRRRLVELLAFLLLGLARAAALEFLFNGFAGDSVNTTDAAVVTPSGLLRLTNNTIESFGHGFYPAAIGFRNASTGAPLSFSTTFVVAVVPMYPEAHGHGLAFALAPSVAVRGAMNGKNLGLFNTSDNTQVPETLLGGSGRLFGYNESFDEFVTMFPWTSEVTTATTEPTSSHSTDEQRQLIVSSQLNSDFLNSKQVYTIW